MFLILNLIVFLVTQGFTCDPHEEKELLKTFVNDKLNIMNIRIGVRYGTFPNPEYNHTSRVVPEETGQLLHKQFGKKFGWSNKTDFDWVQAADWIFSKQLFKGVTFRCFKKKICRVHQVIGTCGSTEVRTPQLKFSVKQADARQRQSSNWRRLCPPGQVPCDVWAPSALKCVNQSQQCDGRRDCLLAFDEHSEICHPFQLLNQQINKTIECKSMEFSCGNGVCLPQNVSCDGFPECTNGADEHLPTCNYTDRQVGRPIPAKPCEEGFDCGDGRCISWDDVCDIHQDCHNGKDEEDCNQPGRKCGINEFRCRNNRCIPVWHKFDGDNDCYDNSDERRFELRQTPHQIEKLWWKKANWVPRDRMVGPRWAFDISTNSDPFICRTKSVEGELESAAGSWFYESDEFKLQRMCFQYLDNATNRFHIEQEADLEIMLKDEDANYTGIEGPFRRGPAFLLDGVVVSGWTASGQPHILGWEFERNGETFSRVKRLDLLYGQKNIPLLTPTGSLEVLHAGKYISHGDLVRAFVPCDPDHEFECDSGHCIPAYMKCDGYFNCPDISDESSRTCSEEKDCDHNQFNCGDGHCIDKRFLCDNHLHCRSGRDEDPDFCRQRTCQPFEFQCEQSGGCIDSRFLCDGEPDCSDGTDEGPIRCKADATTILVCPKEDYNCGNSYCLKQDFACTNQVCDLDPSPNYDPDTCYYPSNDSSLEPTEDFACSDGGTVPSNLLCDGIGDCDDDSDEHWTMCHDFSSESTCLKNEFTCTNGQCIPRIHTCDDKNDCGDASDEDDDACNRPKAPLPFELDQTWISKGLWTFTNSSLLAFQVSVSTSNQKLDVCRLRVEVTEYAEIFQYNVTTIPGTFGGLLNKLWSCYWVPQEIEGKETDVLATSQSYQLLQFQDSLDASERLSSLEWVKASNGWIVPGAVVGGLSEDFEMYFICRILFRGLSKYFVGRLGGEDGVCVVPFQYFRIRRSKDYEILRDTYYNATLGEVEHET